MTSEEKTFYGVSLLFFINNVCVGLVLPFLPQLFFNEHLGLVINNAAAKPIFYSMALASFPLMSFFGMPFFGIMSDRHGQKYMLLLGLSLVTINYILTAIAIMDRNLFLFLLCMLLTGFLGGAYSIGNAIIGNISKKSSKNNTAMDNFRLPTIASNLGFIVGPALCIFILDNPSDSKFMLPYFAAAGFGLLSFILVKYVFSSPEHKQPIKLEKPPSIFKTAKSIFQRKDIRFLTIANLSFLCGIGLFLQALPLYLTIHYSYSPADIGVFSVIMNTIGLFTVAFITKLLMKKWRGVMLLKIVVLALTFAFFFEYIDSILPFTIVHDPIIRVWFAACICYLISPICKLSFKGTLSESVDKSEQGLIMGSMGQTNSIALFMTAMIVSHAVLHHMILIGSGMFMLTSLFFLLLHLRNLKNSK
jgi:MFS family permease